MIVLFFVLSTIVFFIGGLATIYVVGAVATGAPLIVLLPILGPLDWIIETLWNGPSALISLVVDFITGRQR
jgi:hypothetical protein